MPTKKEKQPLSVTHPELAKEADGWDPSLVAAGSHSKLNWKCNKGHIWLAAVQDRSMDGHLTQQWETAILRMLKAKGADVSNAKIAGKFDGYSEAWSKPTFEVKSIKELMRLTEEFEGTQR